MADRADTGAREPMRCPVCDSANVQVDYRMAVVDQGTYVYPATCECGERLGLPLEPGALNKMVKVKVRGDE